MPGFSFVFSGISAFSGSEQQRKAFPPASRRKTVEVENGDAVYGASLTLTPKIDQDLVIDLVLSSTSAT
jgi:hypothetical protein